MKHKMNIGYIGFSLKIIKKIVECDEFNLSCILCETGGIMQADRRQEIIEFARDNGISYYEFDNCDGLLNLVNKKEDEVKHYLIYECNVIIGEAVINSVSLYNLHPGDLKTNRGCHPIHWAILDGMERTCITLYKITPKIDLGTVIGTYSTTVEPSDTYTRLKEKLETFSSQLLVCLYRFIRGELDGCEEVKQGIYRRKIAPSDYTIDLATDSLDTINAKIRSQSFYGGAIVYDGGHTYRVQAVYADQDQAKYEARESNNVLALPAEIGMLYAIAVKEGE